MTTTTPPAIPAPGRTVRVLDRPPAPPPPPPAGGAFAVVLPALGGVGMLLFMVAGGHRVMIVAGLVMLVVTVGGAIGMAVSTRSGARRQAREARERYLVGLDGVRAEVRETGLAVRRHDDEAHPDPDTLLARVATGRVRRRRSGDPERTCVRVGTGPAPHPVSVELPDGDADPVCLRAAEAVARSHRTLPGAALVVDLLTSPIVVRGTRKDTAALARWIVCEAAATWAAERLPVTVRTDDPESWAWCRWLPHVRDDDGLLRIGPSVVAAEAPTGTGEAVHPTGLLVVDHTDAAADPATTPGLAVLHLTDDTDVDTTGATEIALVGDAPTLEVTAHDGGRLQGAPDLLSPRLAESFARAVAARAPVGSRDRRATPAGTLPPARVLGVDRLADFTPVRAATPRPERDLLTVTVGRDTDGRDVVLDLKESGHGGVGPHGLLVGATGSGKSELLRTIVLGLAAGHHPDDLAFVLVDFKGGATFSGLEDLPHVAGVVTNLGDDLTLVDRVRTALLGEITRRQQVLHDAGRLTDVYAHRAARTAGVDVAPLPHLLVVVDEFAELLTAAPDLMDLFTTIGRIGRSIGVHQLLASQRLDDGRLRGLESFLSYRFALRTFTADESRAVIGTNDAAELPTSPGVGYFRTDGLTRFQAAYVSGPEPDATAPVGPAVEITRWWPVDDPSAAATPTRPDTPTVLADAVARMTGSADPTRRIWLPPLPARLTRAEVIDRFGTPGPHVARVGLVDLPSEQRVAPLDLDLAGAHHHLAVLGGPDSGRSSALRAVAHALADRHTPEEIEILGVDLDGDSLRPLEVLPHTASIAGRRDDDLTRRILGDVLRTIDARADLGRPTPGSPDTTDTPRGPEIVLLLDGYGTLRMRDDLHDQVAAIATRGSEVGVHVLLTAARWHDLRPALQTTLHGRVELHLAETMDSVLDRRLAEHLPADTPGRAVVGAGRLAQFVLPGDGVDERAAYGAIAARHTRRARPVALLPRDLRLAELLAQIPVDAPAARWLGVGEDDLRPVALAADEPHLLVLGDRRSGRTSLLRSLVTQCLDEPATAVAVVDPRRALGDDLPLDRLAAYATTPTAITDVVHSLVAELARRCEEFDRTGTAAVAAGDSRVVLLVDDAELVTGTLNPLAPLEPYLARAAETGFSFVLARHGGGAARALYDPLLQRVKELGCPGLLLSGDPEEGPLWPGAPMRPLPPGRAVLARRGIAPTLVHLARP